MLATEYVYFLQGFFGPLERNELMAPQHNAQCDL